MSQIIVNVASQNPVKIRSVQKAAEYFWGIGNVEVVGHHVESGVSHQPRNKSETEKGVHNRIAFLQEKVAPLEFIVAIESGVEIYPSKVIEINCIGVHQPFCISSPMSLKKSKARTVTTWASSFDLPIEISKLIQEGWELGPAADKVYSQENSKQQGGMVGLMTDNKVLRGDLYYIPLLTAFNQIVNRDKFPG